MNWINVDSSMLSCSTHHLTLSYLIIHNSNPIIKYSLAIQQNLTCSLSVFGVITQTNYGTIKSKEDLLGILKDLESKVICIGNSDKNFMDLVTKKGGKLYNRAGKNHYL